MDQNIIFYDGQCALCHWFVRFSLRRVKRKEIDVKFSSLQGVTAAHFGIESSTDTIVFLNNGKKFFRYNAIVRILIELKFWWAPMASILPSFLGDIAYGYVAKNRHKIKAKPIESCPILPEDFKKYFLN